MGTQRVKSHTRRNANGDVIRVDTYQRTGLDAVLARRKTAVDRRRKQRAKTMRNVRLSPRRAGKRLRRAWDAARKRKKVTAAVLAVGGLAEIGGFMAARGLGALALGIAIALTALASLLLTASGGADSTSNSGEVKEKLPPKGARPRSGPTSSGNTAPNSGTPSRRNDGAPETARDRRYFDAKKGGQKAKSGTDAKEGASA